MTNVRCKGGKEIDLLAINPITKEKYHIESRVSTTFKLREKATMKENGTSHKNGLDYFKREKFEHQAVTTRIKELFGDLNYSKVLVVHDTEEPTKSFIQRALKKFGIYVLMKDIIADLKEEVKVKGSRDDIMRFVELIAFEDRELNKQIRKMLEQTAKEGGFSQNDVWKRLMKLMRIKKRTEFTKILKLKSKTSTQILREKQ